MVIFVLGAAASALIGAFVLDAYKPLWLRISIGNKVAFASYQARRVHVELHQLYEVRYAGRVWGDTLPFFRDRRSGIDFDENRGIYPWHPDPEPEESWDDFKIRISPVVELIDRRCSYMKELGDDMREHLEQEPADLETLDIIWRKWVHHSLCNASGSIKHLSSDNWLFPSYVDEWK
jgi:hypothetical protein